MQALVEQLVGRIFKEVRLRVRVWVWVRVRVRVRV